MADLIALNQGQILHGIEAFHDDNGAANASAGSPRPGVLSDTEELVTNTPCPLGSPIVGLETGKLVKALLVTASARGE